jgi:hypothetical protein
MDLPVLHHGHFWNSGENVGRYLKTSSMNRMSRQKQAICLVTLKLLHAV